MSTLFWLKLSESPHLCCKLVPLAKRWLDSHKGFPCFCDRTWFLKSVRCEFDEGGCYEMDEVAIEYEALHHQHLDSKDVQSCCVQLSNNILSCYPVVSFKSWIDTLLHIINFGLNPGAAKLGESFRKGRPARKCGAQKTRKHRRNFNLVCQWSQHRKGRQRVLYGLNRYSSSLQCSRFLWHNGQLHSDTTTGVNQACFRSYFSSTYSPAVLLHWFWNSGTELALASSAWCQI